MAIRLNLSTIVHIYYVLVLFLYLYAPPFTFLPYNPAKFMLLAVVGESIITGNFKFSRFTFKHFLLYGVLVTYTVLILLYHGTIDEQTAPLRQIVTHMLEIIIFSSLFVSNLMRRGYNVERLRNLLIQVVVLQSTLIVAQFISPSIREFISSLTNSKFSNVGEFQWFRGLSLSLTRNFDFSLLQSSFLILIGLSFRKYKPTLMNIVQIVLILFSVIASGRTGFIGVAIFLALITMQSVLNGTFWSTTKTLVWSTVAILIAYNLLGFIFPAIYSTMNDSILPWAFEFYYSFTETGEFTTESSDQLFDLHYYALGDETLIHGDGMYQRYDGMYYGLTDAGYMRHAMYFGVPGIILFILTYFNAVVYSFKSSSKVYRWFIPIFFLLLLVGQYKGDVFTASLLLNRGFYFCVFAFSLPIIEERRQAKMFAKAQAQ